MRDRGLTSIAPNLRNPPSPGQQVEARHPGCRPPRRPRSAGNDAGAHGALDEGGDVGLTMRFLGPVALTWPDRRPAHGRRRTEGAGVDLAAELDGRTARRHCGAAAITGQRLPAPAPGRGQAAGSRAALAVGGTGGTGTGLNLINTGRLRDLAAQLTSTPSPRRWRRGTSMVALSDSRVAMASSALMLSPTFTNSSMTGTSVKSPMSGTFTSTMPPPAAGCHSHAAAAAAVPGGAVPGRGRGSRAGGFDLDQHGAFGNLVAEADQQFDHHRRPTTARPWWPCRIRGWRWRRPP